MGRRGRKTQEQPTESANRYSAEHIREVLGDEQKTQGLRINQLKGDAENSMALVRTNRPFAEVIDHDPSRNVSVRQELVGVVATNKYTLGIVHASVPLPGVTMARHEALFITSPDSIVFDENDPERIRSGVVPLSDEGNTGVFAAETKDGARFTISFEDDGTPLSDRQVLVNCLKGDIDVVTADPASSAKHSLSNELGEVWAAQPDDLQAYSEQLFFADYANQR